MLLLYFGNRVCFYNGNCSTSMELLEVQASASQPSPQAREQQGQEGRRTVWDTLHSHNLQGPHFITLKLLLPPQSSPSSVTHPDPAKPKAAREGAGSPQRE